ncbi:MAG: AAA family ATPase [Patescibacteria group bacterium]|nr:AAA family ATPase [Patescibacteria group bacterium]
MNINIKSSRVAKSKIAGALGNKQLRNFIVVVSLLLAFFGGAFIYLGQWYGWLVLIVPTVLFMFYEWYHHDLSNNLPAIDSDLPDKLMATSILKAIKKADNTPLDIIRALNKDSGFWFIANRLTIHPDILESVGLSDDWWPKAVQLYRENPTKKGVDGSYIIVALILTSPDKASILSVSHNTEDQIIKALNWYVFVNDLIDRLNTRKDSGGIARDWAAGYTPMLDNFAQNISRSIQYGGLSHRDILGHSNVISQMANIFQSNGRANIALVGEVGSGKSTIIQGFAESLLFGNYTSGLQYSQIYQIDIAALLTRVEADKLDYIIQRLCSEAYSAKNIVLYFDNAGAFFGEGGGPDATNIILPILEAGHIRMIFSFTPVQWQYLQRAKSQVVAGLNYQAVQPTQKDDTIRILENQALFTEGQYNCTFTYEAILETYRLAERYGPEIAMPGRAISVLEDAARSNQSKLILKSDVQSAVEQVTGIKISTADTAEKDVLLSLESKLRERVIGQDAAVKELVSALKRSRAGVANPNKPIGTFLFLGPTGVGKTEMSKTLANVYFGGNSGMVRVDMNEYITQDSVHKLLQGSSDYGTSFLESVRRQPFTVILFDELEKAHPEIINTLLQLLDEGSIKDSDNRVVSFKDAIIIATSNAGADIIREKISQGVPVEEFESSLTDELIERGVFKPEFINRFDDVIIFAPLNQEQLHKVVRIMLGDINVQLQAQGVTVNLTDDAVDWLASQGYDERLGARPLRRMMQKTVETVVSDILLQQQVEHGTTITINTEQLSAV